MGQRPILVQRVKTGNGQVEDVQHKPVKVSVRVCDQWHYEPFPKQKNIQYDVGGVPDESIRRFQKFPYNEFVKYVLNQSCPLCLCLLNPKMHFELNLGPNVGWVVDKLKFDPNVNVFIIEDMF